MWAVRGRRTKCKNPPVGGFLAEHDPVAQVDLPGLFALMLDWMRLEIHHDYATLWLVAAIFFLCGFLKVLFVKRQLDLTRILLAAPLVFATSNFINDPWI